LGALFIAIGILATAKEVEGRGGAVIMIGPFPIVFGTDIEAAKTLIVLTIVLIILAFLLFKWFL
jgi:uncharacterized protein (TIGR00304 family)